MKRLFSNRSFLILSALFFISLIIAACVANPFTGKRTMALVGNETLFTSSFAQYNQFLKENTVITGTPEAEMVVRVGNRIKLAAEKWAESVGSSQYLARYQWEFNLIQSDQVNAWCMPGGKIVFYTGILPVTMNEDGLAVVMGHEVAHALLNHGQQRVSANVLQQVGAVGVGIATYDRSQTAQDLAMTAYSAGTTLFGTLPFSRTHESEADQMGLTLMIIAGYNPEEAISFWERMSRLGSGGVPQFLSTHPSGETRIADIRRWIPESRVQAERIGKIR